MIHKLFIALITLIAVIAGICATTMPHEQLGRLIIFMDFFHIALPILGFGALVKYLISCCPASAKCCCCNKEKECKM
jgi:hypothetical protein